MEAMAAGAAVLVTVVGVVAVEMAVAAEPATAAPEARSNGPVCQSAANGKMSRPNRF